MRAARLYGYKEDFVVEEVATPEPGPGEVLAAAERRLLLDAARR